MLLRRSPHAVVGAHGASLIELCCRLALASCSDRGCCWLPIKQTGAQVIRLAHACVQVTHLCRLVSLTGTVSPAEQQRELFGDAEPDLTAAGSTTVRPLGAPPSPPPVEQRLAGVPPEPASVPSSPVRPVAAAVAAAAAEEIEVTAAAEGGKDKDL